MPVAMLNGAHGIGDFGASAYEFVDIIADMGFKIWQILPLNPVGYGNSPYQPYSSYAGDDIYIDLHQLKDEGLLITDVAEIKQTSKIDYTAVRELKGKALKSAFKNFVPDDDYQQFIAHPFVREYAVFLTFKKHFNLASWDTWDKPFKMWIEDQALDLSPFEDDIQYEMFVQYTFYKQWMSLKAYANGKGISIMGDMPIYVGYDSLDVWRNQQSFLLNKRKRPSVIAGVPPDYFSKNGQRWGNPIYDWDYLKDNDFKYWIDKIEYNSYLYDIIRIDHFRAFDTYWVINPRNKTARKGEWREAPGQALFKEIFKRMPDIEIVAEDLGDLRKEVHELRDDFGLKGMNIMQFTFNPSELAENYNDKQNVIVYTGTHDNQTIKGYFDSQTAKRQREIRALLDKCGATFDDIHMAYIEVMLNNIADYAIVPAQDILGLGDESRINEPGRIIDANWTYKLTSLDALKAMTSTMHSLLKETKRA